MKPLSFKRHHFPPEIIGHAIWLYGRFTLSFQDVEELLAERGVDVSYEPSDGGFASSVCPSQRISGAQGHGFEAMRENKRTYVSTI